MTQKIAIITGASRGIGAATAKLLAENGYAVCINCNKNIAKAESLAETISKQGAKAIVVPADMSSEKDILAMFNKVDKELGEVTALINNAGQNGGTSLVEDITSEKLHSVFATNVFSTFLCSREAVKRMKQHGGNIINISSEAAKFGGNQMAHYASSKAAINTFTIGFAREVAKYNIRVNAISPGIIDTELHGDAQRIEEKKKTIPMGRMGTPEEVASVVLWLLSQNSSYVSGSIIPVAGAR